MIKNIIFDFGGVLYDISHKKTLKALSELSSRKELFNESLIAGFKQTDLLADFETGRISPVQFRLGLKEMLAIDAPDSAIDYAWNLTLVGLFPDSIQLLRLLRQKYRISLLSNTDEIHYQFFEPQCTELFSLFEHSFFSHIIGKRKPDHDSYLHAIEKTGYKPYETLFVDDMPANLTPAESLGISTWHCTPNNNLERLFQHLQNSHD